MILSLARKVNKRALGEEKEGADTRVNGGADYEHDK
jgi:hypothetical protein